jgi:hypothetical protein
MTENLTADQKQEALFQAWLSPQGAQFKSPEAEKAYKARVTRLKDAIQLKKKPDCVPVVPMTGFLPAFNAGMTPYDVMYDYEKMASVYTQFVMQYQPDAHGGAAGCVPGKMYDILDYKLYAWPGHGVPKTSSYQALEGEYMLASEYDALIRDPSYFFQTAFIPRIFAKLASFQHTAPWTNMTEMYGGFTGFSMLPYGLPDVQASLKSLMEAGSEALKWAGFVMSVSKAALAEGYPGFFGGGCKAPFDTLGDTLRGTRGMMLDIYRQPQKVMKATEALTPIMIQMGASAAKMNGNPVIFIPLHKGADGFLSAEQFRKFYWPGLRDLMLGLIAEGCVPFPWAEGGYNSRLNDLTGIPAGKAVWGFDATDMPNAKKILGKDFCITGNISSSLLQIASPEDVRKEVKRLIDACGKDGGYIMMNGASIDLAKMENFKMMIDATKEYGKY